MKLISDSDTLDKIQPTDLWVLDKFILSKRLGYRCGPAGVMPDVSGRYIVRPCVNLRMMSRGASFMQLEAGKDSIPDGYFWCEEFQGRHRSFDYHHGQQSLAVEGFRNDPDRLDRFSQWSKITEEFTLPAVLQQVADRYEWFNIETIGDNIIEAHFRYNDDFANHNSETIIPVWKEQFYHSPAGDRVGFLLK